MEITGLRKEYRRRTGRTVAVDGLNLTVPEGGVFGFLGPNGSGKTTTIRCLLGLVRPTAGHARIFGGDVATTLQTALPRIGAIVEAPALFPTMTARENLRLLGRIDGIGARRVDQVLDQVGLADRANDPVRTFSLGMRQRLGLASALLKDPALLVLDEPANGLDPAGMREVRQLMRQLGDDGRTVFVSSHLLSEVEQTCDSVAILRSGRCIVQGPVKEIMAQAGGAVGLKVRTDDLTAAHAVLECAGMTIERRASDLWVDVPARDAGEVTRILAAHDLWVTELRPDERTLEDLFLELTSDESLEGAVA